MKLSTLEKAAFLFYEFGWRLGMPCLKANQRLAVGYAQRTLQRKPSNRIDLWIQSASVGEAYLTLTLLESLVPSRPLSILLTGTTEQGVECLRQGVGKQSANQARMRITCSYFPFDRPSLMTAAVSQLKPKAMVLMESEIWPGLLLALKKQGTQVLIINGRMTEKSAKRYLKWPGLWRTLSPHEILAMSTGDADRFARVFGAEKVTVMSNMKFDRLPRNRLIEKNPLQAVIPGDKHFVVLGSTREEEEADILRLLQALLAHRHDVVIGLFPRHIHRLGFWEATLKHYRINFIRRSIIGPADRARSGRRAGDAATDVILWDVFGELQPAYALAKAVFVGGSLVPLGGQNFLEPLACGVIPVIGPFWDNFQWVGDDIIRQGLLRVARDWRGVAEMLLTDLDRHPAVEEVRRAALDYIDARRGGTRMACNAITRALNAD